MNDWEVRVGMADMYGTVATVGYYAEDEDGDAIISLRLGIGNCEARTAPTAVAARQLAAALLDAADALEPLKADASRRDQRP